MIQLINHYGFLNNLFYFLLVVSFSSCKQRKIEKLTSIKYNDTIYNIGNCSEGDTLHFYIKYKNIGDYPLNIKFSQGDCSCTQPHTNKISLNSNCEDSILVDFYSVSQVGNHRGTVIVSANTNPTLTQVFFTANIIEKK